MAFNYATCRNYFFIGIAGTGMSAIAQFLQGLACNVSGSDRLFGPANKMLIQEQFEAQGIQCFYQDGSGITANTEVVVVSTAIEESNIEYQKAIQLGIPIIKRSALLAAISSTKRSIAVGGTSGKSTTTAMIFHILNQCGLEPSLMTGAGLSTLQEKGLPGNAWVGKSDWLVIESDESDGSIINYIPEISLVLNIDRDHKELDELLLLFSTFKANTKRHFIVNASNAIAKQLSTDSSNDFGTDPNCGFYGSQFEQHGFSISFYVNGQQCQIPVIGKHNMENALAAIAAASSAGLTIKDSIAALKTYSGIYRRTQLVGQKRGVYVIDDFAHNPAEVAAAIKACQQVGQRVLAWFQPHGFGPLKFMRHDLTQEVMHCLRSQDLFFMSAVYYAGGTVAMDITAQDVVNDMNKLEISAQCIDDRNKLAQYLCSIAQPNDVILLMGARDTTLADFAKNILASL